MAKQTINPGTAPTGAGGDTFRSGSAKLQANDDELYKYLGDGTNLNKLGTAAFKNTGTQDGNVMEVGAFGLGRNIIGDLPATEASSKNPMDLYSYLENKGNGYNCYYSTNNGQGIGTPEAYGSIYGFHITNNDYSYSWQIFSGINGKNHYIRSASSATAWSAWFKFLTGSNTSTDSNGFIKAASPIVQLYSDKIELNDEAQQQNIEFKKLGVGDYLIKNSTGFSNNGWYIETPKDANGNLLVAVVYEQLENGDISVKTYDYMLNKKGRIVADTEAPLDIPESRWIDLRLQELPKPEIEIPEPIAPPEFQPTGLAQAVATVMESYHDPEQ
ncbi:phage tail protein [Acinetobacter lwoffii]|uniref:phage tail fiber protein n=1 Tax=Acinetobacter lwoffii TaxID=28090 RepID=UPI00300BA886